MNNPIFINADVKNLSVKKKQLPVGEFLLGGFLILIIALSFRIDSRSPDIKEAEAVNMYLAISGRG